MSAVLIAAVVMASQGAAIEPINLADFARVVQYSGDSPESIEARELERGEDGWPAWKGDDGQSMIGIEWDEPRDIAETEIEFRHAIADREQIHVQYFKNHWPSSQPGGWAPLDDPFHGQWFTAKSEWWAGDREVGFSFVPYNQEQPGEQAPAVRYRRAYRLRFLLGKRQEELPAVRYLRAYGPGQAAEAGFEVRFDRVGAMKLPLDAAVVNGYLISHDDHTTTRASSLDAEPAKLRIRYAADDTTTTNRTVVTLRDKHEPLRGMSFLPAEAVRYGIIRVPALGVVIAHVGGVECGHDRGQDLARHNLDSRLRGNDVGEQPGASVYDRVATEPEQTFERARREIPELKKTAQLPEPLYLPLGPPDARQEIAVSYDGSIYLNKSALKIPADDNDRLHWPADAWRIRLGSGEPPFDQQAEGNVKQALLDGFLPIVINRWEHEGIRYEQTCVATFLDPEPAEVRGDETVVLLARLNATNPTSQPADAIVKLWIEPEEQLMLDSGHVSATGAVRGGKVNAYEQPRYRLHVRSAGKDVAICPGRDPASQAICWKRPLAAGQSETIEWRVPFVTIDTPAERERIAQLDFDQRLEQEAKRWRALIDQAATIEVPEPLLNDFYKAQLAHILITADRDPYNGTYVLPAGTFNYGVCLNESCHQIRALEIRGLHAQAERYLDAIVQGQSSRGLHGRFTNAGGVLHGLPSRKGDYQRFNYNLDHGFALWLLNEHYRFTRDRRWLSKVTEPLIAACDFITRQCNTPPESNLLGKDDTLWGQGLLPPGHLEDPPEWLWWFAVNAYAARGLRMTAESLTQIGDPDAARIAQQAEVFDRHLRDSCRESMVRAPVVRLRDGTYVPHQPTRSRLRDRDLGWIRDALYGPVHLIDCGVYRSDSPEAEWILRDTEDNVFLSEARGRAVTDFDREWFSWGGITLQSNLLPNPLVYLQRGQRRHAIRAFYNSLAANVYADVRTFTEHPIVAYGLGRGPFYKSPDESAFIVWLRHLLIAERGKDLELLAGAPSAWLAPGQKITVRHAATWFGPIDLQTESQGNPNRIVVRLAGPERNPPQAIHLHVPTPTPMAAVTLNGDTLSTFDPASGTMTLPGTVGRAEIVISY